MSVVIKCLYTVAFMLSKEEVMEPVAGEPTLVLTTLAISPSLPLTLHPSFHKLFVV